MWWASSAEPQHGGNHRLLDRRTCYGTALGDDGPGEAIASLPRPDRRTRAGVAKQVKPRILDPTTAGSRPAPGTVFAAVLYHTDIPANRVWDGSLRLGLPVLLSRCRLILLCTTFKVGRDSPRLRIGLSSRAL